MDVSKVIDKKIDYWKKKLIDLSKRNNLVRYRFTKSKSLKIISPFFFKVIEDLENEQNIFILKRKRIMLKTGSGYVLKMRALLRKNYMLFI